jgi:hypothetical protein
MDDPMIVVKKPVQKNRSSGDDRPRKPYKKPCLEELGDLRAITLGSSPGPVDSGGFGAPPF